MKDEFKRASEITEQIMSRRFKWSELFAKHDFFQKYRYYLQIVASSGSADDQLKWSGMVESKIRQLIVKLEFVDQLEVAHPFVKGFNQKLYCLDDAEVQAVAQGDVSPVIEKRTKEDMRMTLGMNEVYTTTFYIGMKLAERKAGTSGPRKLDISYATTEFTKEVKQWGQYHEETHGIVVRHIKSLALPDHVFDGGVQPRAPKTLKRPKSGGPSLVFSDTGPSSSLQTKPKNAEPLPPVSSPDVDREIVGAFSDLLFEASTSSESRDSPSKNAPSSSVGHPVPISRFMTAQEVVSHLVAHGCDDLSTTIKTSTFDEHPISHGGCSDIYRGQLQDGSRVAIKSLRISLESLNENPKHLKHAARELHTWSKCKHPNIIPLLGLALFRGRIGMVSPWMGQGILPHYLKRTPSANRHSLCIQICEGLAYLHHIGIVHGDLKGANVLVSDEGNAVLTDFGNSSLVDQTMKFTQTTSSTSMTVRWSPAEIIAGNPPTETSDVYALGMTVLETLNGAIPYHTKQDITIILLVTVKKEPPERPECIPEGDESADKLWELLLGCWEYEPGERPSADEVTAVLRAIWGATLHL
ncbi:poly(A) polymerase [Rhizoctonia solani]|uniref:Poly(A) polymerase n=1 Tax=Rhizoctonia solani TaxID=456999 RepID=A0A0K6G7G1_9AGAM|nr:poly(A) polymerase [Rhizoctonia solani]